MSIGWFHEHRDEIEKQGWQLTPKGVAFSISEDVHQARGHAETLFDETSEPELGIFFVKLPNNGRLFKCRVTEVWDDENPPLYSV